VHLIAAALFAFATNAHAAELDGVTLPDTATVDGQTLVLNGMGLREKYFIDVYVGGLYLPAKMTDGNKAIQQDTPKKIVMQFIYSHVEADKMVETYQEGFEVNPAAASLQPQIQQFLGWMQDVKEGDQVVLEYAPGKGTTLTMAGKVKGTIPGPEFMRLVFSNYIGPNANKALRTGLLGQ